MIEKWKIRELGTICDILDKYRIPITKRDRKPGKIPYYGASGVLDFVEDYIFDEKLVLIGEDGAKWGPGEKTAFTVEGKCWVNNHAHVIRPDRSIVLDEWIVFFINFTDISKYTTGLTVPKLNQTKLRQIKIPIPPLPEQRRIVALLDQVFEAIDKARENTKKNIENIREYFESILNNEIIKTNNNWETNKIVEITGKIGSGATPRGGRKNYKKTGTPLIRSMNVYDEGFRYNGLAYLDNDQAQGLVNVKVIKDDILLNITGASILRCCIVPEDVLPARVNQHVSIIRPIQSSIDAKFLHYSLISKVNKEKLMKIGTSGGSTREALTKSNIEEFEVSYPKSLTEQKKIVARLKETEILTRRFIELLIQKEEFLNEMRNSIINKAFLGEL